MPYSREREKGILEYPATLNALDWKSMVRSRLEALQYVQSLIAVVIHLYLQKPSNVT